ncbi:MAG: NADH-quinone oxidoreductase subunit N [Elusimicrobia bacterium]|nr:NADH-quinone oxidoreductase subunit N [Elusimicrobiota bacterium]
MTDSFWLCAPVVLTIGLTATLLSALGGLSEERTSRLARFFLVSSIVAALCVLAPRGAQPGVLLRQDGLAVLWQGLFLLAAIPLAVLMPLAGEGPALLLGSVLIGMTLLAAANHLILFFLGLELMSLPSYLLVERLGRDKRALEAAIKYFFAGSVGSALFLFGVSIFYSLTGTLAMDPIGVTSPRLELALALMGAGALFKAGAAPLHFWLPDVYEASAPELVGFFSTGVKAAALLFLFRVLLLVPPAAGGLSSWLPWVSVATMTVGNVLALRQTSLQRLLAYSSIAHVGYLLLGVWAWNELRPAAGGGPASPSVFVYAAAYLFMSTGAFLALRLGGLTDRRQLAGFAARRPSLAAFLALMLLSLASIPPTGGFLAKLLVFWDAIKAGGAWLAVVAAANSIVGLAYYFALIRDLYLSPAGAETAKDPGPIPLVGGTLALACAIPTFILGLWPGAWELAARWLER